MLTMNRPEQRNALNRDLFRAIGQAFVGAETDPEVRAIVLTGAGDKAFCAGMDLKAFAAGEPIGPGDGPGTTVFVERCYPKPIVAAVNGAAVAGGFGVMLGCDIIVAAEHATFGLPEVKRGLVGVGATTRASLRLPPAVTLELALTGEPMDAQRALHYGLVNRVVPASEVLPVAIAIAEQIAANAPLAVAPDQGDRARRPRPARSRHRHVARSRRVGVREQRRQGGRPRLRREAPARVHRYLTSRRTCVEVAPYRRNFDAGTMSRVRRRPSRPVGA